MMGAAVLMVSSCSSGTKTGGYDASSGASYNSSYDGHGDRAVYYGGYGRELPQSLDNSVTNLQKVASRSMNRKTKDRLGHKPGPRNFRTVIIDAGHGGRDSGAIVGGVSEKTLALDVARRLRAKLRGSFKAVFIRNGDYFVDLDRRVSATHKFDDAVLVSIHLNHSRSSSMRGPETYYFRVDSYSLAKRMQRAMAGVSRGERSRGLVRRRLRLTRNPQIPCVLVELGYLSNSSERRVLSKSRYRDRMAGALASALKAQKRSGDGGMGKLPAPLNRPLSRSGDPGGL